ncbi:ROK family protein [Brachybacterium sp. AOP43-C2-M15]|uniref:ROK family protein n=1 Tax=Brachybacterium sp. AOP43-C2-M15 TaxID=3457661 RepID=UPI004033696E
MDRRRAGAAPRSVRQWNEFTIVDALRSHGPQRIAQLMDETGLSHASISEVLRVVIEKGWVAAGESPRAARGRPPQQYRAVVPEGWVIGLDVGPHMVRAARLDLEGRVVHQTSRRVDCSAPGSVLGTVGEVMASCGLGPEAIWLTTISVSATIGEDGLVERSVSMPSWEGERITELFGPYLPSPALVTNDTLAASWAEFTVGAAADVQDMLLVRLGRRPSLSLILGGEPRLGHHHAAGDLSANPLLPAEQEMSWLAPYRGREDPLGDAVRAAVEGDPCVRSGARDYVLELAPALALAASVVDPEVLVISGALSALAPYFLPDLVDFLGRHFQEAPEVRISPLDQHDSALGGAHLAIRRITGTLADSHDGLRPFTREAFFAHCAL